ncbi:hypothetical protein AVEN_118778-1 [Araneus ventricosus]|uniref:Uncharacterized protein n=1 Tax=Araneus ventricosus TaxID=182803 RepID=A0A4Y2BWD7_ARAVE|nr:hypothetical protein AVEN_118778-1 [Araneus ventricosus]
MLPHPQKSNTIKNESLLPPLLHILQQESLVGTQFDFTSNLLEEPFRARLASPLASKIGVNLFVGLTHALANPIGPRLLINRGSLIAGRVEFY